MKADSFKKKEHKAIHSSLPFVEHRSKLRHDSSIVVGSRRGTTCILATGIPNAGETNTYSGEVFFQTRLIITAF